MFRKTQVLDDLAALEEFAYQHVTYRHFAMQLQSTALYPLTCLTFSNAQITLWHLWPVRHLFSVSS